MAFILGLDAGSSWSTLTGFQEWLLARLGNGHDLTWPDNGGDQVGGDQVQIGAGLRRASHGEQTIAG